MCHFISPKIENPSAPLHPPLSDFAGHLI
jgi:hypothetical protein